MARLMRDFAEATDMAKKLVLAIGSFALLSGTIALQGCSDSGPYGYGPDYYSGPAYYGGQRYYAGNGYGYYDEYSNGRDRDINNDARAIRQGQANIRHDKQELHEDLEHGDYGAAAHEQAEIQQRRANVRARQADLNAELNGY
jgi:hypothetical protein